jgi:hypothetical protein
LRGRIFSRRRLSSLAVTRDVAETKLRGSKRHLVSAPPRGSVRYRPPEAIEGSFRQTDQGEISPSFVRCCPRFLHLLPFQPACPHPRAGCRRQISRLRWWVSPRPWRLDWRGGNRWRLRRVNCRAPPGRTPWPCRGERGRERWVWFRARIQRERRPEGELTGGQNKPRQGMGQCQECASAWRDHTFSNGIQVRLKLARQPRGRKNASLPHEHTPNQLVSFMADQIVAPGRGRTLA